MCTVCHTGLVRVGWGQLPRVHRGEVVPDTTAWGCVCSEVNVVAFVALACTRRGPRFKGMSDEPGRAAPRTLQVRAYIQTPLLCCSVYSKWGILVTLRWCCLFRRDREECNMSSALLLLSKPCTVRVSIDLLWPWALHLRPAIKSYFHTPPLAF